MKCQFCGNPATVHLTDIVHKKKREQHLCEACAREQGLIPEEHPPQLDVKALMNLLMGLGPPSEEPIGVTLEDPAALNCEACGLKYGEFRAEGRLGCAHDYDVFRDHLEPLLERIHRSTAHDGKTPIAIRRRRAKAEVRGLKKQLQQAIKAERYEDAARIRDLIREKEALDEPR
jgi:protein arginine kinase activator